MNRKRKKGLVRVLTLPIAIISVLVLLKLTDIKDRVYNNGKPVVQGYVSYSNAMERQDILLYDIISMQEKDIHSGNLILVNADNEYDFEANEEELVCVFDNKSSNYKVKDKTIYLLDEVVLQLNQMLSDCTKTVGSKDVAICSGYRTFEYQENLYSYYAETKGLGYAKEYVAKAGASEHHTGLAIDFAVYRKDGSSPKFAYSEYNDWIAANAHRYGFILRYSKDKKAYTKIAKEEWHYRYVGIPHAYIMAKREMCLEEYIEYVKEYSFDTEHLVVECENKKYEIYYVEGNNVAIPKYKQYSISGNNIDGFIVTIINE